MQKPFAFKILPKLIDFELLQFAPFRVSCHFLNNRITSYGKQLCFHKLNLHQCPAYFVRLKRIATGKPFLCRHQMKVKTSSPRCGVGCWLHPSSLTFTRAGYSSYELNLTPPSHLSRFPSSHKKYENVIWI